MAVTRRPLGKHGVFRVGDNITAKADDGIFVRPYTITRIYKGVGTGVTEVQECEINELATGSRATRDVQGGIEEIFLTNIRIADWYVEIEKVES